MRTQPTHAHSLYIDSTPAAAKTLSSTISQNKICCFSLVVECFRSTPHSLAVQATTPLAVSTQGCLTALCHTTLLPKTMKHRIRTPPGRTTGAPLNSTDHFLTPYEKSFHRCTWRCTWRRGTPCTHKQQQTLVAARTRHRCIYASVPSTGMKQSSTRSVTVARDERRNNKEGAPPAH